jgi:hypothetical protein
MKVGGSGPKTDKPKVIRAPKQVHINEFQFYPPRLVELQNKEFDAHRVSRLWSQTRELCLHDHCRKHNHMSFPRGSQRRARLRKMWRRSVRRSRTRLTTVSGNDAA